MQIKLLETLVEELAGVGASKIVVILFNKKDVNEFLIARKMEMTINQVRNILYKLSAEGLVSFTRKRDKKKGWYIYYWTLNTEKCLVNIEQVLIKKINELNSQLKNRETKRYYICRPCNIEVNEETALEHGFSCEECASVYELSDGEKQIREIKAKITKVNNDLKVIRDELVLERTRVNKKRVKKEKKDEKEKIKKKKAPVGKKKITKKAVKKKALKRPVKKKK